MEPLRRPNHSEMRQLREECRKLMARWEAVIRRGSELEEELNRGLSALRESSVLETLREVDIDQAEHPDGPIRTAALHKAGIHTVADVLSHSRKELVDLPGFGETSARRVLEASERIAETARQSAQVRLGREDPASVPVLRTIYRALRERPMAEEAARQAEQLRSRCRLLDQELRPATGFFRWLFNSRPQKERALAAADAMRRLLASETAHTLSGWEEASARADQAGPGEVLRDFEEQAAAYYAAAETAGGIQPVPAAHGDLDDALIARVESYPLDTSLLRVTLRGYQAFGAKFALEQRRTLLGDEMGLGKTVEAIAVMADLAAKGGGHFLVVCPAGVLINWSREIARHSGVPVLRLYGEDRDNQTARWLREGGAGVTTYETLQRLDLTGLEQLDLLIADEAHYVKNPEARRTRAVTGLAARAERVLYLTGTPLENRVEEMCALLEVLDPDTAARARTLSALAGAQPFRQAVAPVYLRRRREEVLRELPGLTEKEEWCEAVPEEREVYRRAVEAGNFMAMRQAGWSSPGTGKARRLAELCEEAAQEGRRVLVFSFFRDTMEMVQTVLGKRCLAQIHGGVPAEERQEILDRFSRSPAGTALCCQVQAGGVGLNIQAASEVIFCEPQLKPSTESQAISRAYRMGQTRTVTVRRLLTEDTVDEEILTLLEQKQELFDDYADRSAADDAYRAAGERAWIAGAVAREQERLHLTRS